MSERIIIAVFYSHLPLLTLQKRNKCFKKHAQSLKVTSNQMLEQPKYHNKLHIYNIAGNIRNYFFWGGEYTPIQHYVYIQSITVLPNIHTADRLYDLFWLQLKHICKII